MVITRFAPEGGAAASTPTELSMSALLPPVTSSLAAVPPMGLLTREKVPMPPGVQPSGIESPIESVSKPEFGIWIAEQVFAGGGVGGTALTRYRGSPVIACAP